MKFKHGTRRRALEYEKDWAKKWKENEIFEKSIANRPENNHYVFYDGPPFITGVPHHGTLLSSVVKDAIPRYQTMKGKRVERVWGWDCHGLPAEVYTEKKLGISDRREIGEKISLEKYIIAARENMVQTSSLWNDVIERIGRWVDMEHAYRTMDKEYMESIWWAFKTLYEKGKIYEGERVLLYCTREATPLSKAEVTMDAGSYKEETDPSVFAKFQLENGKTLLAWTTTPWTLPANTALAISPKLKYVEIEIAENNDVNSGNLRAKHAENIAENSHKNSDDSVAKKEENLGKKERFIIAENAIEKVLRDEKNRPLAYKIVGKFAAKDLAGMSYAPFLGENRGENAHKVWAADFVNEDDGSGIVHVAPAYGEDDFNLAQEKKIPIVHVIDENGFFAEGDWQGENVWEINKQIAKDLKKSGQVWKIEYIRHPYPHCHRCGTRLMYRAHPSWFFDVQGQKDLMLEKNQAQISWFPPHLKNGRYAKNIEQAPDWNMSRDRFWATALPVWEGVDGKGAKKRIVVGSYDELFELSGKRLDDYHRPWVDEIEFDHDGVHYKRIDKVLDGWFESGSMPFAQFHYPFENKEHFEANFPGDFVSEYVGQVRAWFYYMNVISVGLFGQAPFKNVITTGVIAGNDGRKMSKSYGNYTDPNELMDKFSADSLRFLFLSSPLLSGEDFALHDKDVGDIARKLSMIWNMFDFFTMYAEVDDWEFSESDEKNLAKITPDDFKNPLDKWIISRIHELNREITENMDEYNISDALAGILPFIDDASNWFVRRSRRRFWKSEDDADKNQAYQTLHYILWKIAILLAPFTPFLAEELYQKIGGSAESVHLLDWPENFAVDQEILDEMAKLREYVSDGLALRAKNSVKVRQPLASVKVPQNGQKFDFAPILLEELNVKNVEFSGETVEIDFAISADLKREGISREIIRFIQNARKNSGLDVDDRIVLQLNSDNEEISRAIEQFADNILAETLAHFGETEKNLTNAKIAGANLEIALEKV